MTGAICFASSLVMRKSLISPPSPCADRDGFRTRYSASGSANIAIAKVMKPNPDCKSINPMVKRGALNCAVSPTVAMISPKTVINNALDTWPVPAKAAMAERPTIISAKYSAEWNNSATEDNMGAKTINRIAPIVPPANEAIAAIVNALPALP